ncbi:MAG: plasmid mobilization protein [Parafilimonas sp.]
MKQIRNEGKMLQTKNTKRNKGGRPKKAVKQNYFIGIKCTLIEKTYLKRKAKMAGLSLSEFIREAALKGQTVSQVKLIPKEILQFTATLNHMAANINQLAKKSNQNYFLDEAEKAALRMLPEEVKQLATSIKNCMK